MSFLFKARRKVVEVVGLPGPTSAGGASMNVYLFDNNTAETVEYGWLGQELVRYEGEPREVPPGTRMPDAPPRPKGAAPLPPSLGPPPAAPAAPLQAQAQAQVSQPSQATPQPQPARRTQT